MITPPVAQPGRAIPATFIMMYAIAAMSCSSGEQTASTSNVPEISAISRPRLSRTLG